MLNYQRVNATGFQENEVSLPPPVGDFEGRFHWAGASMETAEMILSSWRVWRQVDSRRLAGGFIFGQEMRPAGSRIQDSWIECHWVKICKNPMKQNKDGYSRRCCIPGVVHIILFFFDIFGFAPEFARKPGNCSTPWTSPVHHHSSVEMAVDLRDFTTRHRWCRSPGSFAEGSEGTGFRDLGSYWD